MAGGAQILTSKGWFKGGGDHDIMSLIRDVSPSALRRHPKSNTHLGQLWTIETFRSQPSADMLQRCSPSDADLKSTT